LTTATDSRIIADTGQLGNRCRANRHDQASGLGKKFNVKTWFIAARILLGLMFVVFGINGFLPFIPNPPSIPQNAMTFFGVMVQSHFSYFVFGVQLLSGLLLLANRFVPLAIVTLAAVLANVIAFHVTMWPASLVPMPLVATVLWFVVAWSVRESLSPLLSAKASPAALEHWSASPDSGDALSPNG
jgi:putative oxidoreductase